MTSTNPISSPPPTALDSATASDTSPPPAVEAVAHLIIATHRQIASAHEHGRKAVGLRDTLIARFHFAVASRLARLAWRFATAGKRRLL